MASLTPPADITLLIARGAPGGMMALGGLHEIPSLGKPFHLGMLYDCRSEKIIPGISLWDTKTLKSAYESMPLPSSSFEILAEDSIQSKTSNLDVKGSLKASFLAGMVQVTGSANFLNDTRSSKQQSRVTLKYTSTTHYEELTMEQLSAVQYKDVFANNDATHVVLGVIYGFDAFFVFDRDVSSSTKNQDIQGGMAAIINLGIADISGSISMKMTEKDIEESKKLRCTFYGDFILPSSPSTYEEAVKICSKLPSYMEGKGVPKTVYLYPLLKLENRAQKMVRSISEKAISEFEEIMESLNSHTMHAKDLKRNYVCSKFGDLDTQLSQFLTYVGHFRMEIVKMLSEMLPKIRGGTGEESMIADLISKINRSPFNSMAMADFLDRKEKDIQVLDQELQEMLKIPGLEHANHNDLELLIRNHQYKYVVCFAFNVTSEKSACIGRLGHYLKNDGLKNDGFKKTEEESDTASFQEREIPGSLADKTAQFVEFIQSNAGKNDLAFAVVDKYHGTHISGATEADEQDIGIDENERTPSPDTSTTDGNEGTVSPIAEDAVDNKEGSCSPHSAVLNPKKKDGAVSFSDENKALLFLGPALILYNHDRATEYFDPPTNPTTLQEEHVGENVVNLVWFPPDYGAESVLSYNVLYRPSESESEEPWSIKSTGGKVENLQIDDLEPDMEYNFKVVAVSKPGLSEDSGVLKLTTEPVISHPAKELVEMSLPIPESISLRNVYRPSLRWSLKDNSSHFYRCEIGFPRCTSCSRPIAEKVLLIVGDAGSNKNALINGMASYVLGVKWDDPFRFEVVVNTEGTAVEDGAITAYTFQSMTLPYDFTLINIPEFDGPAGKGIAERIRKLFTNERSPRGFDMLHGIGFVAKASTVELTWAQIEMLKSIRSIFDESAAENIFLFATCADAITPPLLNAMKNADLKYKAWYRVNSSALFVSNTSPEEKEFNSLFWKIGTQTFTSFFKSFARAPPKSVQLKREELNERERLVAVLPGLLDWIEELLLMLNKVQQENDILLQHEADISKNIAFTYEVQVARKRKRKIPYLHVYTTNCEKCDCTCHYGCDFSDDEDKVECCIMVDEKCTVCPEQCNWESHHNTPHCFDFCEGREFGTSKHLEFCYKPEESDKTDQTESMLANNHALIRKIQGKVYSLIAKARQFVKLLDPTQGGISEVKFIEHLIDQEDILCKFGWKDRVKQYRKICAALPHIIKHLASAAEE